MVWNYGLSEMRKHRARPGCFRSFSVQTEIGIYVPNLFKISVCTGIKES